MEEIGESKCFFEKENVGSSEHHGLRSPVSPHKYIAKDRNNVLVLTTDAANCVEVKVENKVLVNLCYYYYFFQWCFYLEI